MNLQPTCTPAAAKKITGRKMADDELRRSVDFPGPFRWGDIPEECDYFIKGWPAFSGCTPGQEIVRDEGSFYTIPVRPGNLIRGNETGENHG
jgi:hypothetical protein